MLDPRSNSPVATNAPQVGWPVLIFAILLPTLVTLIYFVVLKDAPAALQQSAYAIGKTIQFAFPIVWVSFVLRERPRPGRARAPTLLLGAGFGIAVLAAMLALYYFWLKPSGYMDASSAVAEQVRGKIAGLRLNSATKFWALAAFYSLVHSGLEEYYWRWFVFGRLRVRTTLLNANVLSSVGFALHHVLLLGTFFGYGAPATWIFSIGIAIGGAFWAWLYDRSQSIWPSWLSHLIVDAAIFIVGYDLVRESFS